MLVSLLLLLHLAPVHPSVVYPGAPGKGNPQVLSLVKCIYSEGWEEGPSWCTSEPCSRVLLSLSLCNQIAQPWWSLRVTDFDWQVTGLATHSPPAYSTIVPSFTLLS
jgi:hypothetical protein